jgi:CBS domain-containing protein
MTKRINGAMTKEPVSIASDVELNDALELMRSWGMRHLPVTTNDGKVVGLLSERDIWRYIAFHPDHKQAQVRSAMSTDPFIVKPADSLADVAEKMAANKYGCAIVAGEKGICGIFTTTDALKILAHIMRGPDHSYKIMRIEEYFRTRAVA